jgi:Peptidase A4 family
MKFRTVVTTVTAAAALTGLGAASASAATVSSQEEVSQNWAGYVAGGSSSGTQFSSVSGSWVQPTVNCNSGSGQSYSAYWVGLGGSSDGSDALEQTGTQGDCTANGGTEYYAWYELVPSAPVQLSLAIHPGDHIAAKVSVSGSNVTVWLSDQTTGQSTTKNLQMSNPDTSSAEWIAEAPSQCDSSGDCQPLPLADFGTVQFSGASATANGHTGTISDSEWGASPIALGSNGSYYASLGSGSSTAGATPSSLSSDGSAFSVAWQQNASTDVSGSGGSGTGSSAGGSGDGGYGNGGYGDGGYPGGYGGYGYGGGGYGYGAGGYGGGYGGYGDGYGGGSYYSYGAF